MSVMMPSSGSLFFLRVSLLVLLSFPVVSIQAQGQADTPGPVRTTDPDYIKRRVEWFYRGRVLRGQSPAELRRRAYQAKLRLRAERAAVFAAAHPNAQGSLSSGSWTPLGPEPIASDASGNGTQDY